MENFASASRRALQFLQARYGLGLWVVTRASGHNWIVLTAEDDATYGVGEGAVLKWSDTLCSRMVDGQGPHICPVLAEVPAYSQAPVAKQMPIGAYVGFPLTNPDGTVFGTLCGIDPASQPAHLSHQTELVRLVADLLSEVLHAELAALAAQRGLERAVDEARHDELTKLFNRRAWVEFLETEERRCRRYGHPACVIAIDLDGLKATNDRYGHVAGDELLQRAASACASGVRSFDIVARTGGGAFMILCLECGEADGLLIRDRISDALQRAEVPASIGIATRTPETGLYVTAHRADEAMYAQKASHKAALVEGSRVGEVARRAG